MKSTIKGINNHLPDCNWIYLERLERGSAKARVKYILGEIETLYHQTLEKSGAEAQTPFYYHVSSMNGNITKVKEVAAAEDATSIEILHEAIGASQII
jgi:hypothetical protein